MAAERERDEREAEARPEIPPPPDERPPSSFLLLGVNLLILAAAIFWVFWRLGQSEPGAPGAEAGVPGAGSESEPPPLLGTGPGGEVPEPTVPPKQTDLVPRDFRPRVAAQAAADAAAGRESAPRTYDAETLARMESTRDALARLGVQAEVLRSVQGAYPSSAQPDFGANRGVEALVLALEQAGRLEPGLLETGDTDGDGRCELLDPWGRPLVYFSNDDYPTSQGWGADPESSTPAAALIGDDGRRVWHAAARFQLWSLGPDGENDLGQGDDVTSWLLRR